MDATPFDTLANTYGSGIEELVSQYTVPDQPLVTVIAEMEALADTVTEEGLDVTFLPANVTLVIGELKCMVTSADISHLTQIQQSFY